MGGLISPSPGTSRHLFITNEIEIKRTPQDVWPYLVDWERLDRWMPEGRDFRLVGEQREGVGVEAEATITVAGIRTHDRIRVIGWNPPWSLEIAHVGWVKGTGYMELSPREDGRETHIFWREELIPPLGRLGRIGLQTLSPLLKRTFRRDLRLLKELAESERR